MKIEINFSPVLLIALFLCSNILLVKAQDTDTLKLTIDSAIKSALENNPEILIQRKDALISEKSIMRSRAVFEPILSARVSKNKIEYIALDSIREYNELQVGINQRTPIGTNINLFSNIISEEVDSPRKTSHTAGLSITQALLQGLPLSANTADIKRARIDSDMSQLKVEFLSARIVNETQKALWNYYLAQKEFEIIEKTGEIIDRRLEQAQTELEIGSISRVELAQIEAEAADYQRQLISSKNAENQAKLSLLHVTGKLSNTSKDVYVKIDDMPEINWFEPDDINDHLKASLEFRQDLKEAQKAIERNEVTLIETRNGLLPKLDFFVELSATSYAQSFGETEALSDPDNKRFSAGLSLNLPLLKTDARARHSQSKYRSDQSQLALENMENLVILDVIRAYENVNSAIKLIQAAQKSFEARELFFEMQTEKFNLNQITPFEYLQSARDFMQSQLELERAKSSYALALTNLYFLDGTILAREGY